MSAAMVDLDVVAAALGVSTDAGVVEALHPVEQQLDRIIAAVWKVKFDLEGSVPNADQALAVAVGHLSDALSYLLPVVQAAESHLRGRG
jgi:hypothetical protein